MTNFFRSFVPALALVFTAPAAAQVPAQFPDKPVRFVVPFPVGGATDSLARLLGAELSRPWGQQVIVENRAGAQGNVGTAQASKAPGDGYTIFIAHQGVLTINPHLYSSTGFDTFKDIAPVIRATVQPFILVVHPSVPVASISELTALAKKQPGRLTFASTASGPQMMGELYKIVSGVDLTHVPYKGAGPAVTDLLAGQVNMMFASPSSAIPHVKAGKLRGLATLGAKRMEALPDLPTAAEAGVPQLGEMPDWYGVAAPATTPAALVHQINAAIANVLKSADVQSRIRAMGLEPSPNTPEEFALQIRADYDRWAKVVKASGAKAD